MICKPSSRTAYKARVQRVLDHLHAHLDAPLDLNALADIAGLSPYHWHRVYRELQGETIHATQSRLRLQHAAKLLGGSELSLQRIARRVGYSAVPPFARAFKAAYGVPPGRYRTAGLHARYRDPGMTTVAGAFDVRVREEPGYRCVSVAHTGRHLEVDRAFSMLFRALGAAGVSTGTVRSLGVYFDDPGVVDERRLESLACASGVPREREPDALDIWDIPAGPHAVLHHRGPYDALDAAYRWLFGCWLPDSGHEPADSPVYERYLDDPRVIAPMDLRVEVCLPLARNVEHGHDDGAF